MPPVSEKQRRFMGAVASGSVKKPGLSMATAREFLHAPAKHGKPKPKPTKKPY